MIKDVTILTGFLGAGKTTLLNAFIKDAKEIRYAVIENEIGMESIDSQLVVSAGSQLIELNDGCLCCSLSSELIDALDSLLKRSTLWDELIIEATGIADPANIALPFLTEPEIQRFFKLKSVICVVDAELVEEQLKETSEAISQISFADVLLINKTEQVSPGYIHILKGILSSINPFASVLTADKDGININELRSIERNQDLKKIEVHTPKGVLNLSVQSAPTKANSNFVPVSLAHSHKQHQHSNIETILLRFDQPMDMEALRQKLRIFLLFQSQGVYRIKGIIYGHGSVHKMIFQSVGQRLSITQGAEWPDQEPKESKIVIIGKELQLKGFKKIFSSCLSK